MSQVVNSAVYAEGRKVRDVVVDEVSELLKVPGQFVWIGLHEPTDELLGKIQAEFGLHDLAIEDARRAHRDRSSRNTATRCSWCCGRRSCGTASPSSGRRTSSSDRSTS